MTENPNADELQREENCANEAVAENLNEAAAPQSEEAVSEEADVTDEPASQECDTEVGGNVDDQVITPSDNVLQQEKPENEEQTPSEEPEQAAGTDSAVVMAHYDSKEQIINRLKELLDETQKISRKEVEALKSAYYKLQKCESEEVFKTFVQEGGNAEDFVPQVDVMEAELKELLAKVRDKRNELNAEEEHLREENYQKKQNIIDRIKEILEKPDEVNSSYDEFKNLQQEWKGIKDVPADKANDLFKTYQLCLQQFYDTLKLNNEFRAYDFKKNLELKLALCEKAEKLADETDVISASRKLQDLHQQFREIGPVENSLREEVWNRFKTASTIVNKKHQAFFAERKLQEEENLQKKTEICELIESKDFSSLSSFSAWNEITKEITELQAKWKTIGFAPQKMNVKIYERYRQACDKFFEAKSKFFKDTKDEQNKNLALKLALCEKAEALKDSTDWKETTETLKELQKEWKTIGPVPKKHSDTVWKRFTSACDAFFDAKGAVNSSQKTEQTENLNKKLDIIERLKAIVPEEEKEDVRNLVRTLQEEWNGVGHVPFKDKDKVYAAYKEQLDRLYKFANVEASRRRVNRFRNEVNDENGSVRSRLVRERDILTNEINTYENNLGFLNISSKSKSSNSLVEEINRKIAKLKDDLAEIKAKIKALDEKKNEE